MEEEALSSRQIAFNVFIFLGILLCYSQQTLTNLPLLYTILQCVFSATRLTISKPCFTCNYRNRTYATSGMAFGFSTVTNDKSLGMLCMLGNARWVEDFQTVISLVPFFAHEVFEIKNSIKILQFSSLRSWEKEINCFLNNILLENVHVIVHSPSMCKAHETLIKRAPPLFSDTLSTITLKRVNRYLKIKPKIEKEISFENLHEYISSYRPLNSFSG